MKDRTSSTSTMSNGMSGTIRINETSGVAAAEAMIARDRQRAAPQASIDSGLAIAGDGAMMEWFGGVQRQAGVNVSPETAMRSTAVWRCVTLIAGALMCLPLSVYRRSPQGDRTRVDDHPFNRFLAHEPNDEMSAPEFIELQAMSVLLRGNGYGLIRQAKNGTLTDIDWYHPLFVMPYRSTDNSIWYRFTNMDGTQEVHHASYVLHFRGPGRSADQIRALSPIAHHAQAVGVNLATRDYTAGQFERGLMTNDYFGFPDGKTVTAEQRAAFKEYLRRRAQGVSNAHNPLILENGAEWKRVSINAKDAQLLELLQYSVVDIARIFGVPPHMIGETTASTSWGTGLEQQGIAFVRYTVMPHMRRMAKELTRKLFPIVGARVPDLFVDFDPTELMSGDAKAQGEYFRIALGGNQLPGFMTQNEVRRAKNLPPKDDGDTLYKPEPAATGANGGPAMDPEKEPDDASQAA